MSKLFKNDVKKRGILSFSFNHKNDDLHSKNQEQKKIKNVCTDIRNIFY